MVTFHGLAAALTILMFCLASRKCLAAGLTDATQLRLTDNGRETNSIAQVIQTEIRRGIETQMAKHMRQLETIEANKRRSKYELLMGDLREVMSAHQANDFTPHSTASMTDLLGSIEHKLSNLTTVTHGLVHHHETHKTAGSCAELRSSGHRVSGVYNIHLPIMGRISVYCDMTTDGGGWTVFQRRINGSVDFYREWLEYMNGFGRADSELWIGLRALHYITHTGLQQMYIHLEDFEGNSRFAQYDFFAVSSEATKFRLDLGSYFGNAGDGMVYSRDNPFSTKDQDNDNHPDDHCATRFTGGWWYNSCFRANLNGRYDIAAGQHHRGIHWNHWKGDTYSLKSTTMMIRPAGFHIRPNN